MTEILNKFTDHSKHALKNAFSLALSLGQKNVLPLHILYGISQQKGSVGAEILNKSKIDSQKIKEEIVSNTKIKQKITDIKLSTDANLTIEQTVLLASKHHSSYVGTEHLLAAIFAYGKNQLNAWLNDGKVDLGLLEKQIGNVINSSAKFPDLIGALDAYKNYDDNLPLDSRVNQANQSSVLDFFATNLTDRHVQKDIDPVIGRETEIKRVIQILSRRHKNNPLLLGDPGVGKTAIVEGLAKKILQKEVPEILLNKKIYTLDLSSLLAGTSFRGEFENRLRQIMAELKRDPDIIIFIDELHNLTGAGAATGSMDAANILKPALARGEIRCIGATTTEDYKKYIESDAALERRFQPVYVSQPSVEKTVEILHGIKHNYENFHRVKISDDAIVAAATMSERYLTDRFLPDKAIDLIDEAASAIKVKYNLDEKLQTIINLEKSLQLLGEQKSQLVEAGEFNKALDLKNEERDIKKLLENLRQKRLASQSKNIGTINKKNIAQIIARMTGVPMQDLLASEKKQLLNLAQHLNKKIVGQTEATKTIAQYIRRARTGVANANRPIGSFMFLGPSGVGKTELAKILAQEIFGSPDALIRLDMSEFAESFNASKLIGSPAGYVGYKESTKLTDAVRKRPYSVVLFDEIEKAHPQIFNLLLSVLEDGHLTDAVGKKINFKNTVIIMTSNLGSEEFNRQAAIGFSAQTIAEKKAANQSFELVEQNIITKLKNNFRPEFINRLDKIIIFKPLDFKSINKIAKLQLQELKERLSKVDIKINFDRSVGNYIAKKSYSPEVGARAIRKQIQEEIENKIAETLLLKSARTINIKVIHNKLIVK